MRALVCNIIYTGIEKLDNHAILIDDNGIISSVTPANKIRPDVECEKIDSYCIAPGFIDLQVNGSGGAMFSNTPDVKTISTIAQIQHSSGVTGFLPTIISSQIHIMDKALASINKAINEIPGILGIHYEGPFLNPKNAGIHSVKNICSNFEKIDTIITPCDLGKTLVTLAPECVSIESIERLVSKGVIVAAGHTSAGPEELSKALKAGLTGITHLFNAMEQMNSRSPGTVGGALAEDNLWCSIITDGYHVHKTNIASAWRAKPRGKLLLVSDGMPPTGINYIKKFKADNNEFFVKEGRCLTSDGKLAGAILTLDKAVRFCVHEVGIPIDEALRMASTYPAQAIKEDNHRGLIAPKYIADLVSLDKDLKPRNLWIGGKSINILSNTGEN